MNDYTQPPHDVKAEASLLAILMSTGQSYRVADSLKADDFYLLKHQTVYRAIQSVDNIDAALDTNTVDSACRDIDSEWADWTFIRDIQIESKREYADSANLEAYGEKIAKLSLQRKYLAATSEIQSGIFSGDMNDLSVDVFVESKLRQLNDIAIAQGAEIKPWLLDEYEALTAPIRGVSSGYKDFDRVSNGICETDLIVLTGKPGTGKTTLAMNIAQNVGDQGGISAIASMEMPRYRLLQRLIASEARISLDDVQRATSATEEARAASYVRLCKAANMYVDDTPSRTVSDIRSQTAKVIHRAGKANLLLVDYLGLMGHEDPTEKGHERIASQIIGLKNIAKSMNLCVLCLVSKNRAGELMGAAAIEYTADVIIDLEPDEQNKNVVNVKTQKARHAEKDDFKLAFEGQHNRFTGYVEQSNYTGVREFY